ncbi:MAG: hypothetical protein E6H00_12985 [Bacillati bacterium ANGP1]|uniref:Uncharacterized protein n=1 Tax=Candidatus Segetimicrobium genomatis TaxID=2569760 RepID=A0A537JYK1_9BACT|nr:MAG: hypothetical protein E6H00_12985 [Terrabacteria group bacterium ANGP1]
MAEANSKTGEAMNARGRPTSTLDPLLRERLTEYRVERCYSLRRLRSEMQAPFVPATLGKALEGLPVFDMYVLWIERWIRKHLESTAVPLHAPAADR